MVFTFSSLFLVFLILFLYIQKSYAVPAVDKATPTPLSIPPSQSWIGNDGPWSSFLLHIGSPVQKLQVLVSTSSNQPWVILPPKCPQCAPVDCPANRGGYFDQNGSSTWSRNTMTSQGLFTLPIDVALGEHATGTYGYDDIAFGNIPPVQNQVVAGVRNTIIYTGFIGLHPAATNFSSSSALTPSYLSNLKSEGLIPSLSYGYTAGNHYRPGKPLASLTLGGCDLSLFEPNKLSIPFNHDLQNELSVSIESIRIISPVQNWVIRNAPIKATIDSTTPYLHFPTEVCQQFEEIFGIKYDELTGLYLVNEVLHKSLLQQSANVTFTLTGAAKDAIVNITLPYEAFDLIAEYPLVSSPTRYFPLKRVDDGSQPVLGRTFLQEAYIITDHERSKFSVHQRKWTDKPVKSTLKTIFPSEKHTAIPSRTPPSNTKVIVAISTIISIVLFAALLICLLLSFRRYYSKIKIFTIHNEKHKLRLSRSPPRPRISRPILTPLSTPTPSLLHYPAPLFSTSSSTPSPSRELEQFPKGPFTPTRNGASNTPTNTQSQSLIQVEELDSQPVSPVSPEIDSPSLKPATNTFQSFAGRITQPNRPKYQQLYDEIVEEVRQEIYSPSRDTAKSSSRETNGLEDPFTDPIPSKPPTKKKVRIVESEPESQSPRRHPHISTQLRPLILTSPRIPTRRLTTPQTRIPIVNEEIYELPATPGLGRVQKDRAVESEIASLQFQITEVERAMIRERQVRRRWETMREERRLGGSVADASDERVIGEENFADRDDVDVRRFSAIGAGWI